MHWLDIVVIVLIVLFALYGLSKGFLSSLLSLVNVLVSFVAAIFLAKPLATFINGATNWGTKLCGLIGDKLAGVGSLGEALTEATSAASVVENSAGFTGFFKWLMPKLVGDGVIQAGEVPATYFGNYLGSLCLIVICGIVIFIAIRIVVALLQTLFKKLRSNSIIGSVDKLLGFLFGAVKGFVAVCLVIFTINFIPVANTKFHEQVNQTTVTLFLSNTIDSATEWISKNVDFKKIVEDLLPKLGEQPGGGEEEQPGGGEEQQPGTPTTPGGEGSGETPSPTPEGGSEQGGEVEGANVLVTFGGHTLKLSELIA